MRSLSTAPTLTPLPSPASPWARVLLTGHRGAAAYERHNTRASFVRAVAMGADMLECDVRQTRDGALVLAHDGIVGHGRAATGIARITLTQVRAMPDGADLLTLADFLAFAQERDLLVNIDVKAPQIEVALVAMLCAHDFVRICTTASSRRNWWTRYTAPVSAATHGRWTTRTSPRASSAGVWTASRRTGPT